MRQQGTVKVRFTIDQNGRVISHQIVTTSGHPLLDQEAAAMLNRASPMPKIPRSLGHSRLTITLPIAFNLR
jgi:protein TonB